MHHIYFIRGLNNFKVYPYREVTFEGGVIFDRSNHHIYSMITSIVNVCSLHKHVLTRNFTRKLSKEVGTSLDKGHKVTIMGHSYGGMIANRVFLKTGKRARLITFGSIETIKPHKNIVQFMAEGDMACRCNGEKVDKPLYTPKQLKNVEGKPSCKVYMHFDGKITWLKTKKRDVIGFSNHFQYPVKKLTNGVIKL
jgi:hypothetical protein